MSDFNFEEAIARLEEINNTLSLQQTNLDLSMELFEEGLVLLKKCDSKLKKFETSIDTLIKKYQGEEND